MSDRWLRLYESALHDPKLQRLPGETFKGLINLWCLASAHGGTLPALEDIAFALRLSEAKASALLKTLCNAGLLDEDETGLHPHNWDGRQFKSDVSTTRVKRFRERRRNVSETADETAPDTDTDTDSVAEATAADAPADERTKLFRDGLATIIRITGKPEPQARSLIGRWLKATGDDCRTVGRLIEDADRDRRADPIAWIEQHFKPRPARGPPGAKVNPDGTVERWAL